MKKIILICFISCIFGISVFGATFVVVRDYRSSAIDRAFNKIIGGGSEGHEHADVRKFAIKSHLQQVSGNFIVVSGDSLTESLALSSLCGMPILNAGIGGATTLAVNREVMPLLSDRNPFAVVLAVGINDARRVMESEQRLEDRVATFKLAYSGLVKNALTVSPRVVLNLIAPVGQGMALGDRYFDPALIARLNTEIKSLAVSRNLSVIKMATLADADGYALNGVTTDGVHLTRDGYTLWRHELEQLCKTIPG